MMIHRVFYHQQPQMVAAAFSAQKNRVAVEPQHAQHLNNLVNPVVEKAPHQRLNVLA